MPLFTPNISVFRVALAVLIAATALGAAEKPRFLTPEESLAALQLDYDVKNRLPGPLGFDLIQPTCMCTLALGLKSGSSIAERNHLDATN